MTGNKARGNATRMLTMAVFIMTLVIMQWMSAQFQTYSQGVGTLDMRLGYDTSTVQGLLGTLGVEGRQLYTRFLLIDLLFIVSLALVQSNLQRRLLQRSRLQSWSPLLLSLAYVRALLDLTENACILTLLARFPTVSPALVRASSLVTTMKFVVLGLWLLSIVGSLVLRKKKEGSPVSKMVVVYKSTYGATRQYAEHIAQQLGADLLSHAEASPAILRQYETIVYGGGLYAGGIAGVELVRSNYLQLAGSRLVVFSTGFTPVTRTDILTQLFNRTFNAEQRQSIQFYHFPGNVDYKRLQVHHRIVLAVKRLLLSRQHESRLTEESKKFMQSYGRKPSPLPLHLTQQLVDCLRKAA